MNPATLRTLGLVTALLMALGLIFASSARADTCQTLTIQEGAITSVSGNTTDISTGLVGQFLWVNLGELEENADLGEGSISHEIPANVVGATVCPDGRVAFETVDTTELPPVIDVEPVEVPIPDDYYTPTPAVTMGLIFSLAT